MMFLRSSFARAGLAFLLLFSAGPAFADNRCDILQREYRSLAGGGFSGSERYRVSAERQRDALAAAEYHADQAGCTADAPDKGCRRLLRTIGRMHANLASLEAMADGAAGSESLRRREVRAQLKAARCGRVDTPRESARAERRQDARSAVEQRLEGRAAARDAQPAPRPQRPPKRLRDAKSAKAVVATALRAPVRLAALPAPRPDAPAADSITALPAAKPDAPTPSFVTVPRPEATLETLGRGADTAKPAAGATQERLPAAPVIGGAEAAKATAPDPSAGQTAKPAPEAAVMPKPDAPAVTPSGPEVGGAKPGVAGVGGEKQNATEAGAATPTVAEVGGTETVKPVEDAVGAAEAARPVPPAVGAPTSADPALAGAATTSPETPASDDGETATGPEPAAEPAEVAKPVAPGIVGDGADKPVAAAPQTPSAPPADGTAVAEPVEPAGAGGTAKTSAAVAPVPTVGSAGDPAGSAVAGAAGRAGPTAAAVSPEASPVAAPTIAAPPPAMADGTPEDPAKPAVPEAGTPLPQATHEAPVVAPSAGAVATVTAEKPADEASRPVEAAGVAQGQAAGGAADTAVAAVAAVVPPSAVVARTPVAPPLPVEKPALPEGAERETAAPAVIPVAKPAQEEAGTHQTIAAADAAAPSKGLTPAESAALAGPSSLDPLPGAAGTDSAATAAPDAAAPADPGALTVASLEPAPRPPERPAGLRSPTAGTVARTTEDGVSASAATPPAASFRTVCVRTCDGYFFPISWSVTSEGFTQDAAACTRLCPGSPTELYSYRKGGTIDGATSSTGRLYKDLPTAYAFRSRQDPACTCATGGVALAPNLPEPLPDALVTPPSAAEATAGIGPDKPLEDWQIPDADSSTVPAPADGEASDMAGKP